MNKALFLQKLGERIQKIEENRKIISLEGELKNCDGNISLKDENLEIFNSAEILEENIDYKEVAREYMDEALNLIMETLSTGESVNFAGWGKWEVYHRRARNRKSLQTGEIVMYPSKKAVRFKLGKYLKQSVVANTNQ